MKAILRDRLRSVLMAGAVVGTLSALLVIYVVRPVYFPSSDLVLSPQDVTANAPVPSLSCQFADITRANVGIRFDFVAILPKDGPPRFEQLAEEEGDQTIPNADHRPTWAFSRDGDGTPIITSPDGATRIVLYGLKPNAASILFIEAGLRSNVYRNLGGKCRQANLGTLDGR